MIVRRKHEIKTSSVNELKMTCPRMSSLIDYIGEIDSFYIPDYFTALCNSIIYQSISYKAATAIWNRFIAMAENITPESILSHSLSEIKSVGLSNSKAQYILNIAGAFKDHSINLSFDSMTNKEVQNELEKIKGIGPWTSEMFLIFCLYRKDVISYGDIAIRRGIEYLYSLDHNLTKKEFEYYKNLYMPHLTIASFYLWEITLRQLFNTAI